ncbi:hypothetical protein MKZ38_002105 [Zalerion maritima]|uniref:BTB domain-containing protein n=1 Tax=Zalerion maritima TaxID=339359 RepID=A0AAD5WSR4_9PEZI|nr:hypothetical protein MKZ38_002105 [Zalerion maritima]
MVPNIIHSWGGIWPLRRSKKANQGDEESQNQDWSWGDSSSDKAIELRGPDVVLTPNEDCLSHSRHPFDLLKDVASDAFPSERVRLVVGTGTFQKKYLVHRELLMFYSVYFARAYRSGAFVESQTNVFPLYDDDPADMEIFLSWLYLCPQCKEPKDYDVNHACWSNNQSVRRRGQRVVRPIETQWCRPVMEAAWVLGDRLMAADFMDFCLGHVVQHLPSLTVERVEFIFESTLQSSSLRRLVRQYVGYRNATGANGGVDHPLVEAVKRLDDESEVQPLWSTRSPMKYEAKHWKDKKCGGDMNATCKHRRSHFAGVYTYYGQPGPEEIPRRKRARRHVVRFLWLVMPLLILTLSSVLYHQDRFEAASAVAKRFSLAIGIMATIGIRYKCMAYTNVILALACGSIVLKDAHGRSKNDEIDFEDPLDKQAWEMEIALGTIEILYILSTLYCSLMLSQDHWGGGTGWVPNGPPRGNNGGNLHP